MLLLNTVSALFKDAMSIYFDHNCLHLTFEGARAQKIELKKLILKYEFGKSLSKEMWCKMADTKHVLYYVFQKMKNACSMR